MRKIVALFVVVAFFILPPSATISYVEHVVPLIVHFQPLKSYPLRVYGFVLEALQG